MHSASRRQEIFECKYNDTSWSAAPPAGSQDDAFLIIHAYSAGRSDEQGESNLRLEACLSAGDDLRPELEGEVLLDALRPPTSDDMLLCRRRAIASPTALV